MAQHPSHTSFDKIAALQKSQLFATLDVGILRKIAELAIPRRLRRGQVLFSEHERASGLYVLVRGEIRSIRQDASGREQVLSTEQAGATLAAVPVFNGGKFYSTMIADTNADVLYIDIQEVRQLCRAHIHVVWNLAGLMAQKIEQYAELIEALALRNVEQRVAQYIVTISEQRGLASGQTCMIEITMTRADIAARLGSVREVISRAFTHLEEEGLIHIEGRRLIIVPNMRMLCAFAGARGHDENF